MNVNTARTKSETENLGIGFLWRQRIGYACSVFGFSLGDFMVMTYLAIFLTDVAKLPVAAVGVMIMVTKIVDAFIDFGIGALVDRTRTKMGRSRPWLLFGGPIVGMAMVLAFTSPDMSTSGKIIWAYVTYLCYSCGTSTMAIPSGALMSSLTYNVVERTNLAVSRNIANTAANLICSSLSLFLINRLGAGDQSVGYFRTDIIFAIMLIALTYIGVFNMKETNLPPLTQKKQKQNIFKDVRGYLVNKHYLQYLALSAIQCFSMTIMLTTFAYYFKYIVGNMDAMSIGLTIFSLVQVTSMLLCPPLNKRFSKKAISLGGIAVQIMGIILLFVSKSNLIMTYVSIAIITFGFGFRATMMWSMQPDTFDAIEYTTGKSVAGVPSAFISYVSKIAAAFASLLLGLILSWGSYDGALAVQPDTAKKAIIIVAIGLPIISAAMHAFVLKFYDLDKLHPQMRAVIDERRAASVSASES